MLYMLCTPLSGVQNGAFEGMSVPGDKNQVEFWDGLGHSTCYKLMYIVVDVQAKKTTVNSLTMAQ